MSLVDFAKAHSDILEPIELIIVQLFNKGAVKHDFEVIRVYDALIAHYRAITTNFSLPSPTFSTAQEASLYEILREFTLDNDSKKMLECLKVLKKSATRWNKERGSQGYLQFIADCFPI